MRWLKIILVSILTILVSGVFFIHYMMNRAFYGTVQYDTEPHEIVIPENQKAILSFSKTNAYRHGNAIEAANELISSLAEENGWFVYMTEDAGIFNEEQINTFDLVIWNNSTGTVLNDGQRAVFKNYIANGGGYLGIHAAGDKSHQWPWYVQNVIGAQYSHHPIRNHIQEAEITVTEQQDSTWSFLSTWMHRDEWYIFKSNPRDQGFTVTHRIDGTSIDPNGNLLWLRNYDFGMGKDHPVAWHKEIDQGRVFYTSLGHLPRTYEHPEFMSIVAQAVKWAGRL